MAEEDRPDDADDSSVDLPDAVVDEAERLTRQTRRAVDENEREAYREARAELLSEHEYTARIRSEERDVLVCHPAEWVDDEGTVQLEQIDDTSRGIEVPLEGVGDPDDWETIGTHNEEIAEAIEVEHGDVHGANARALAEFLSNHYAKPIEEITESERSEFLSDYYKRNVWPTDDQEAVVEESVRLTIEHARTLTRRGR